MTLKKILWSVPALLLLCGCPATFTHPTKSLSDFERDRAACERISKRKLAAKGIT